VDVADFAQAKESWLRTFLELPNEIPSHNTFDGYLEENIVRALDQYRQESPMALDHGM
jgi:hypothetical protein